MAAFLSTTLIGELDMQWDSAEAGVWYGLDAVP